MNELSHHGAYVKKRRSVWKVLLLNTGSWNACVAKNGSSCETISSYETFVKFCFVLQPLQNSPLCSSTVWKGEYKYSYTQVYRKQHNVGNKMFLYIIRSWFILWQMYCAPTIGDLRMVHKVHGDSNLKKTLSFIIGNECFCWSL